MRKLIPARMDRWQFEKHHAANKINAEVVLEVFDKMNSNKVLLFMMRGLFREILIPSNQEEVQLILKKHVGTWMLCNKLAIMKHGIRNSSDYTY